MFSVQVTIFLASNEGNMSKAKQRKRRQQRKEIRFEATHAPMEKIIESVVGSSKKDHQKRLNQDRA